MHTYEIKYNGLTICRTRTYAQAVEIVAKFPAIVGLTISEAQ